MNTCLLLAPAMAIWLCGVAIGLAAAPAQQAYLKASNPEIQDNFGSAVAVSGDTLAVSAYLEDSNATGVNGNQYNNNAPDSGAVYVFVRRNNTWAQQAYIKRPGSETNLGNYWFGRSLDLSGNTLAVGQPFEASNATGVNGNQNNIDAPGSGAVFVYVRDGTNWSRQAYLKASNTGSGDGFGHSVCISGDMIVVGAVGEQSSATGVNGNQADNSTGNAGAAYVFVRQGTNWSQQAYLKASNTGVNDLFGNNMALSDDTLVVGAPGENSASTGINGNQFNGNVGLAGAAYVFVRQGTNWSQQAYLKASNTGGSDTFGNTVSVSKDTIVIGAPGEDSNATGVNGSQSNNSSSSSGAAYVFVRNGTTWSQQAYLKASNTGVGDGFGSRVVVSYDTIVVTALYEASAATGINGNQNDNSATNSGAAYVFFRSGTAWSQQAYLKASNTGAGNLFGQSISLSERTLAIGANLEASSATGVDGDPSDNDRPGSGAVYVFADVGLAPPMLAIEKTEGSTLRIFWPRPAAYFVLEQSDEMDLATWSTVPISSYQTNATQIFTTNTSPVDTRFYRLQRQ